MWKSNVVIYSMPLMKVKANNTCCCYCCYFIITRTLAMQFWTTSFLFLEKSINVLQLNQSFDEIVLYAIIKGSAHSIRFVVFVVTTHNRICENFYIMSVLIRIIVIIMPVINLFKLVVFTVFFGRLFLSRSLARVTTKK